MSGRRTRRAFGLAGALLALAVPAAHAASPAAERAADEVFQDYAVDGKIDPCRHSAKTLELARDNITPDVEQYASEYPDAIDAAIAARARGACSNGGGGGNAAGTGSPAAPAAPATTPVPTPAQTTTPQPQAGAPTETVVPDPPAPAGGAATAAPTPAGGDTALQRASAARPDAAAPLPLVALGVLLALSLLLGLLVLTARRLGIGDERLAPVGHAVREARWRWQGTWEDFSDWLRQGR